MYRAQGKALVALGTLLLSATIAWADKPLAPLEYIPPGRYQPPTAGGALLQMFTTLAGQWKSIAVIIAIVVGVRWWRRRAHGDQR